RLDEVRRRRLEVLYDAEQTQSTSPQLYAALLSRYVEGRWDDELADQYLMKMLPAGRWCPEVVLIAFLHSDPYNIDRPPQNEQDRQARIQRIEKLFALTKEHLHPKFGDAMYAATFAQYYIVHPIDAFREGTFSWSRAKTSFEDWDRHFPNS